MEKLLEQRINVNQNPISETEEFVSAFPEICDYLLKDNQLPCHRQVIDFLDEILNELKEIREKSEEINIEDTALKKEIFDKYPKVEKLIKMIIDKKLKYF